MIDTSNYVTLQEILGITVNSPITVQGATVVVPAGYRLTSSRVGIAPASDLSSTTIAAQDALSGKFFYDSQGRLTQGTMQLASAVVLANQVFVDRGYIPQDIQLTVPQAGSITVSNNFITVPEGYISGSRTVSVPQAASTYVQGNVVTTPSGYVSTTRVTSVGTYKSAQTYTPGTTSQVISSGYYIGGAQTIQGDSNLKASNIVSGTSIFGVSGTYKGSSGTNVSSTTAKASDVLSGKIFYNSLGVKTSGTISTVSATLQGSFVQVPKGYIATSQSFPVSGGIDISDTTAQAADVLAGKTFYTGSGVKTSGTIQTVTAQRAGNIVTVPAGYVETTQTLTVPEAEAATVNGNQVSIPVGYIAQTRTVAVGTVKASATYIPSTSDQTIVSGQFLTGDQTIKGDEALAGSNIISGVSIFGVSGTAATKTDFYKCASLSPDVLFSLTGSQEVPDPEDPAEGLYVNTGQLLNGYPIYNKPGYWLWYAGDTWLITDVSPDQDLTQHILFGNNGTPDVTDWPEMLQAAYAPSGKWAGYKAVLDPVTGTYSFQATLTTGLVYSETVPEVDSVYNKDATIQVLMLGSEGWQLTNATAAAEDILAGKTAYGAIGKLTGTRSAVVPYILFVSNDQAFNGNYIATSSTFNNAPVYKLTQ